MTPQQSEASRIDISSEQEKRYSGVTLQSTGKYLAQIHDRKRTATLFLGTFNTDVEAAKLHGSRAVLNVPVHEAGKSISKGCELLKCSGKNRKIKEKGSTVERTISNAESMPRLHIPNTLSILSQKKPSTVKNVAIPPPAAILNMTLRQSIANQTDTSREQEKNYRGVKQQPNGKYIAQIHDRKKGATIFLGTFNTDIEAAKAFDSAAIRLRGSTAVLNLPEHEACKSSSKGCDLLECSGKKRKIKEKGRPVESTISNAEPPPQLHIPNTLTPSSTLSRKKPSIVKNIAIPPQVAILNITVQQSANKAETSMKQEKQYRGVRLQSTGKYGAKIHDPKSKATIWLGTFDSDIEAAKAFDSAAVRLRGSRALLNFPEHEAGKSSSKGCEILKSSPKKRKIEVKGSSVEKHYRGVTLQSSGKYGAKIRDPNSKAYIWLGTFNTNIEAAKAFDSSAVRLCGSRAVLNFPKDEPGKSSSEGSELLESSCKKRKMEEKETSEEKHYRGVYHRPSGRHRAEINNKQGRIGLGTFNKDVEVTKAYDSAAFRLHGIGTVLNFPLEAGKSSSKQSESSQSSCKERKIQEMMNSVDSTIDDVEEVEVESSCK